MSIPIPHAALSAAIAAGLALGGFTASASASPSPYKVKLRDRALVVSARSQGGDLALRLAPNDPQTLQVDVGNDASPDFSVARSRFDRIVVAAGAGDNHVTVDEINGAFTTTTPTTIDGQGGDDVLTGGSGDETLLGGDGNDFVDAGRGADTVDTGAGDDTFVWRPGQGSDSFEGGAGQDLMRFDGAAGAEHFAVAANGAHVRFTRDVGGIVMDLHGVERIVTNAIAGADSVAVGDLTATDTIDVAVNLGSVDESSDQVTVNGTAGGDLIRAAGTSTGVTVSGLATRVAVTGAQLTDDRLAILGLAGNDVIDGADLTADAIHFAADGGAGNDVVRGGAGNDTLTG